MCLWKCVISRMIVDIVINKTLLLLRCFGKIGKLTGGIIKTIEAAHNYAVGDRLDPCFLIYVGVTNCGGERRHAFAEIDWPKIRNRLKELHDIGEKVVKLGNRISNANEFDERYLK